jgi:hypothetical protein
MRLITLLIATIVTSACAQRNLVRHIDRIPQRDTFHFYYGNFSLPERFIHIKNKFYFYNANKVDSFNLIYSGYTAVRSGDTLFLKYYNKRYNKNVGFDTLLLRKGKMEVLEHGMPKTLLNIRSDTFTPNYKYYCHCIDSTPLFMQTGSLVKLGTFKFKMEQYYIYRLSCHYCDRRGEDIVFHPVYGVVAMGQYGSFTNGTLHWMKLFKR